MQKDRRYYGRLQKANKVAKKAAKYQQNETDKMNALKEMFGLSGQEAMQNRNSRPEIADVQPPAQSTIDVKAQLLARARKRARE